ncbi:Scaffold-type E3 ligase [Diplodia intermedia]|uniref:Defective in cullin neddylation protein n=1 Tax=Diplodia intermedia TaxID=856260 RepID=A0ABR3T6B1_9PEZI
MDVEGCFRPHEMTVQYPKHSKHESQAASLLRACSLEVLHLGHGKARTLSDAQKARIQMCAKQLDELMQDNMIEWAETKKSQVTVWRMINAIGMSNELPEVQQWAPVFRRFGMGDEMVELVQKPLHKKNVELEQKIAEQRLPASSTWIILEALYEEGAPLHSCPLLKWTLDHGDRRVGHFFTSLVRNQSAIQQVVNFTSCDRTTAARILRNHNWNAEQAINGYFNNGGGSGGAKAYEANLNQIFDKYVDNPQDKDSVGVDGTMQYLQDLDVPLDDITSLAVLELVQAPTMGEITRKGFVEGWAAKHYNSAVAVEAELMKFHRADSIDKQKAAVSQLRSALSSSSSRNTMKRVYKHTFIVARPPGQKAIPLEQAIEYWKLLYSPSGLDWSTQTTPWLDWWIEFLESKWKRTVNKDMWDQLFNFSEKSLEDETLSFWSEDGAWPGVIDEFVDWARTEKGRGAKQEDDEEMEE